MDARWKAAGVWERPHRQCSALVDCSDRWPHSRFPNLDQNWARLSAPPRTTSSGAMYRSNVTDDYDVQLGTFDAESGTLVSGAEPLKTFVHANTQPDWSPDGTQLVYKSRRSPLPYGRPVLGILTLTYPVKFVSCSRISESNWPERALDGHSFLVQGTDTNRRQGIFRIDAQTGETSPIRSATTVFLRSGVVSRCPTGVLWPEQPRDERCLADRAESCVRRRQRASATS